MKVKFSQKDQEILIKSLASFENDKLADALNVSGAQSFHSTSTWGRSASSWGRNA